MPEPISFRLVQGLQTALRAIGTRDGYYYDVAAIAVKLDPNQGFEDLIVNADGTAPRPLVLLELQPERREFVEKPDGLKVTLPVRLNWLLETDPADDDDRLRALMRVSADTEKAICVDRSLGGLALDTLIVNQEEDRSTDGSIVWFAVDVEITFYRTYGVPA